MYAEPPPLSKTLFGNNDKSQEDSNETSSFFNQAALTVGSLLLIVVFVVVSGGSDLPNFAQPQKPAPQVHSHLWLPHCHSSIISSAELLCLLLELPVQVL